MERMKRCRDQAPMPFSLTLSCNAAQGGLGVGSFFFSSRWCQRIADYKSQLPGKELVLVSQKGVLTQACSAGQIKANKCWDQMRIKAKALCTSWQLYASPPQGSGADSALLLVQRAVRVLWHYCLIFQLNVGGWGCDWQEAIEFKRCLEVSFWGFTAISS